MGDERRPLLALLLLGLRLLVLLSLWWHVQGGAKTAWRRACTVESIGAVYGCGTIRAVVDQCAGDGGDV